MRGLVKRLKDKDIALELTDEARKYIADVAYDPNYGARPVNRYIQKHIETEIAGMIIRGTVAEGESVTIGVNDDGLDFQVR